MPKKLLKEKNNKALKGDYIMANPPFNRKD
jgi:hypothetical protein